jgi:hypothetical protein
MRPTVALLAAITLVSAQKLPKEAHTAISVRMHDEWCAMDDHAVTHGPCMKHEVVRQAKETGMPHQKVRDKLERVEQIVNREKGEEQIGEMHDWWCSRPMVTNAPEDSDLRVFCDGWEEHKRKQEL